MKGLIIYKCCRWIKLSSPTGISISDLLGSNGAKAYMSTREDVSASLKQRGISSIYRDESGENFGLIRKNGHWILVGRINYQNEGILSDIDFTLKTVPPPNLIFYDTLVLKLAYHQRPGTRRPGCFLLHPTRILPLVKN